MTAQRQIIYNIISASTEHPSAEAVYTEAKRIMPSISLGTVYRNLAVLADSGAIRRIRVADLPDRYDKTVEQHEHVICRGCGRVADLLPVFTPELRTSILKQTGYTELEGELSVFGLCPECGCRTGSGKKE